MDQKVGTNMAIVPPMYIQFEYKSIDNIPHFSFTQQVPPYVQMWRAVRRCGLRSQGQAFLSRSSNTSKPEKNSIL